MQVRKQQFKMDMEQKNGSKSEMKYVKAVYCHPAYLTSIKSTSWETLYADDTTLMAESEEELKTLLMKVKEENEKVGLKFNIQKLSSWYLVPSLHGK